MPRQPATQPPQPAGEEPSSSAAAAPPLAPELKMFTNPKKVHEVERMSHAVLAAAADAGVGRVIEFGGGVGRLAQCLALQVKITGLA